MQTTTKKIATLSMLTALTVVLGLVFIIPIPMTKGYVNFLEVGIYTTALLFGGQAGLVVGFLSGGLLDLILGYPQWMFFSTIIHGAQGFIAGHRAVGKSIVRQVLWVSIASCIMVLGYFIAGSILYGVHASVLSIPGNIIQVLFGGVVSIILANMMKDRL